MAPGAAEGARLRHMQLSCAFAPSRETPDHIVRAEELGYHRAWCYDSPALYADVWVTLALAATRTTSIGPGPVGSQRASIRVVGNPANIVTRGTPHAAATCCPAESYPI